MSLSSVDDDIWDGWGKGTLDYREFCSGWGEFTLDYRELCGERVPIIRGTKDFDIGVGRSYVDYSVGRRIGLEIEKLLDAKLFNWKRCGELKDKEIQENFIIVKNREFKTEEKIEKSVLRDGVRIKRETERMENRRKIYIEKRECLERRREAKKIEYRERDDERKEQIKKKQEEQLKKKLEGERLESEELERKRVEKLREVIERLEHKRVEKLREGIERLEHKRKEKLKIGLEAERQKAIERVRRKNEKRVEKLGVAEENRKHNSIKREIPREVSLRTFVNILKKSKILETVEGVEMLYTIWNLLLMGIIGLKIGLEYMIV